MQTAPFAEARKQLALHQAFIVASLKQATTKKQAVEKPVPDFPGLYLLTQPTGSQTYAYRYRRPADGKPTKLTLGPLDKKATGEPQIGASLSPAMAVALWERCRQLLRQRIDPAGMKPGADATQRAAVAGADDGPTVDELFSKFLTRYPLIKGRAVKDSTKKQTGGMLGLRPDGKGSWEPTGNGILYHWTGRAFAKADGTPLLTKRAAYDVLDTMAPVAANRTLGALKLFGSWAEDQEYVSVNPFATLKKQNEETPRHRILSDAEIKALYQTTGDDPYAKAGWLILSTAQRPGEVFEAKRAELDQAAAEWIVPDTRRGKDRRDHLVPLSAMALQIVSRLPDDGSPYLINPPRKNRPLVKHSWQRKAVVKRVAVVLGRKYDDEPEASRNNPYTGAWTWHDLRRTAKTGMKALGIEPHIVNEVLGHDRQGMDRIYDLHDYAKEKRQALAQWSDKLAHIVA